MTTVASRIKYEDGDFKAEIVHFDANGIEVDSYLCGWFDSHSAAYEAVTQELTETLQQRVDEAAMAEAQIVQAIRLDGMNNAELNESLAAVAAWVAASPERGARTAELATRFAAQCAARDARADAEAAHGRLMAAQPSAAFFARLAAAGAGFEPHANDGTEGEWIDPADAQAGWAMLDTPDADDRRAARDALAQQGAADDAQQVENWLRTQPSDLAAARIEVCAVSGDYMVTDQHGRVLSRAVSACEAENWIIEAQRA